MRFFEYLEAKHTEASLSNQECYNPYKKAVALAVQSLLQKQGAIFRFAATCQLLYGFLAMKLGAPAPKGVKEQIEAYNGRTNKKVVQEVSK